MELRKVYYLGTCDTCKKIFRELGLEKESGKFFDLKKSMPDEKEIANWFELSGQDAQDFINKRSQQLKGKGIEFEKLNDNQIIELIKSHYSILARPVFIFEDDVLAGNSKSIIEKVKEKLG
ncbi:arsenate reductase family protein [Marinigracilibium pacificum]|uniref:Arsenate reductase n=1 Tax=Marinigracilibium pacificum TaxID=2729599 RepID=A0A848J674_9BACT|nr:ArsC/Spx/MgsR family protein [Marinigracilibium pacificum]NMM49879.1 hypothetical protein [Marinigracilibium pacificum]